ncbi:hypothetical protein [Pedobacter sp.]|uniref:hypothetical protein n=1 Tax=Pedobacter sp. TaxID=1411316 RepID=UPI003D7FD269
MKNIVLLIVAMLSLGCTKENDQPNQDFTSVYGGVPYKGTVSGTVSIDGGNEFALSGKGSIALMEATKDSVSIVFLSDLDKLGEINIKVPGKYDGNSFYMEDENPNIYFKIIDQNIDGKSISDRQEMTFKGKLEKESGQMKMIAVFKQDTESFPKGTRLELNFDTNRAISNSSGDVGGCPTRLVPVWSPNGVVMGMVPDC